MAISIPTVQQARQIILKSYGSQPVSAGEAGYIDCHVRRYVKTLAQLPDSTGSLLDVGSFPGHLSLLAANMGWSVTGISRIDGTFIGSSFANRMQESGIRIINVNVERDPFPLQDDLFDVVFFNETVEHLPYNPFHALDQIWRVLKPGGTLIFSVPNLASFDHRWALLKGRTIYPLLTESLTTSFHADIGQRHIREYTPGECRYLLHGQDKYLYLFDIRKFIMDRSWDGMFYTEHGYRVELRNIRIGTLLRDVMTRIVRGCRSNIVIQAAKPSSYLRLQDSDITSDGFHPPEISGTGESFVRHPLEACWMKTKGRITVKQPDPVRRVSRIDLLAWLPAPANLAPLRVNVCINSMHTEDLTITPSPEPRRYSIPVPREMPVDPKDHELTITLETTGWRPCDYGFGNDSRTLSIMVYLKQIALVYED